MPAELSGGTVPLPPDDRSRELTVGRSHDDHDVPHIGPADAPHAFTDATDTPPRLLCLGAPVGQEEPFTPAGQPVATHIEAPPGAAIDAALSEILAETDSHRILHLIADSAGEFTQRHSTILRLLVDNASADPTVAAAADFAQRRFKERLAIVADHLAALGAVAADPARTEQILWFYFGFTTWATVRELGWDWPEAAAWLADRAASALLHSGSNAA